MAFTYDETLSTARDRVRFALGDTNEATPLLTDETIDARLAISTEAETVAFLASGLAVQLGRQPERVTLPNGLSVSYSRADALRTAATTARSSAGTTRSTAATRDGEPAPAEYLAPGWRERWSTYDG